MIIEKHGTLFAIDERDQFSRNWFETKFQRGWEAATFDVLARLLRSNLDFIDVGAWIGPITLFAASHARRVLAIEPDPVAVDRLRKNLSVNPSISNVIVADCAVYPRKERVQLGGNGDLGNSESTLLVGDPRFLAGEGAILHHRRSQPKWRMTESVEVDGDTFENILTRYCFKRDDIGLVKVDAEGGERLIIDPILNCLRGSEAALFLSLHWHYLTGKDIRYVVEKTASHFPYLYDQSMVIVSLEEVIHRQLGCIVGSHEKISIAS